jgi:flagellar assembly protein FliH
LSEAAVSYAFEQLEPSDPPPADGPARLLAEASAEAREIREAARSQGHAEGLAAGLRDARAQVDSAAVSLGEAARQIEARRGTTVEAVERDAIELAISLAEKILAGALQARPELVVEVVQGALRRVSDRRRITVLVNPGDLETVRASIGEIHSQANGIELCDIQADQRVGVGGAIVRTVEGEVDAGLATQLERAREVVLAELASGESSA